MRLVGSAPNISHSSHIILIHTCIGCRGCTASVDSRRCNMHCDIAGVTHFLGPSYYPKVVVRTGDRAAQWSHVDGLLYWVP